jgi:hypothetical protein
MADKVNRKCITGRELTAAICTKDIFGGDPIFYQHIRGSPMTVPMIIALIFHWLIHLLSYFHS